MDLNRVTLIGRLTKDPEVRTTPTGKTVASMTVATGRVWTDNTGNKQEKTEFTPCVLWGKIGEIAGQYLAKGRKVYVEGRLETRDWVGQDGVKHYKTEVIVDNMIMLDSAKSTGSAPARHEEPLPTPPNEVMEEEIKVEDIPF